MQCTSYGPVYYHERSVNVGGSGFSWHPFDNNANCGEERAYKIATPPNSMDESIGSDKEALKQIIQNQEATFRNQVQELHRLYRRQRDLMDEMRVREIFAQHLPSQKSESVHSSSHARPEFSQTPSYATSWILGDNPHYAQRPSNFVAENSQDFIKGNSHNEVEFLLASSKGIGKRIVDPELPARMCGDDQGKHFKGGNISESLTDLPNFQNTSGSDFGSVKTAGLSSFDLKSRKINCFIDLNEPIDLESLSSSSSAHFEACHTEIKSESVVPKLVFYNDSSDGINSSMAIDLNSMPVSCFPETEENVWSTNKDAVVVLDHSSVYNNAMKSEKCGVKTEVEIDLNTGMGDENPPSLSSPVLPIKPAEDTELEGPVSPENEECSPPRGKSEDVQVETHENIAAQTLVMILSSGVTECRNPASLCWFADIVSSIGDDLENQIMKLDYDQGENALNYPHVKREKESGRSGTGGKRGIKHRKVSEDVQTIEGSVERGPLRRKAGKKACGKPRKYSKQSSSDVVKKSINSMLKQPATRSKQGILHSWGKTRKRQGGRRHRLRLENFSFLAELI